MSNVTLKHTCRVKKRASLTTRCSSLMCVSAAQHHTEEQYSKTGRTILRKHLPRGIANVEYSPSLPQEAKLLRRSSNRAKMLLKNYLRNKCHSHVSRSSDSFSTVPAIVNRSDWECIVRYLKTIIVLVLLAFNFNPKGHTTY